MLIAALLALAAGAIAGIYLATRHFLRKRLPASVALFHGLGGATGFALVLLTVVREPDFGPARQVLYLLIATVLLGAVNLLFHIRRVRHRTSLILLHGLTAVTAASMLVRAIVLYEPTDASAAATPPQQPAPQKPAEPTPTPSEPTPDAGKPETTEDLPTAKEEFAVDKSVQQALERPIIFETKSAELTPGSRAVIRAIAKTLQDHPDVTLIEVQGHADERGEDSENVELTRARATAVVDALAANGIAQERLRSAGYGARCPKNPACGSSDAPASCHTAESWARDRRVMFVVLQVGKAAFQGEVVCAAGADLMPSEHQRFHAPVAK